MARVSNPENQEKPSEFLINYLIKNNHWSPFEMVNVVLEINTTRDIARQLLRHRSFSFQEFSQRYADVSLLSRAYPREARLQDTKNRQSSLETSDLSLKDEWEHRQKWSQDVAEANYQWAIQKGVAKEVARSVLPEGLTMSRMYMNGTLRSWLHFLSLRTGNGTQKETQELATMAQDLIMPLFPNTFKAISA